MPLHRLVGMVIGIAVYTGGVSSALADAIDGHWCFPDGKRMFILGPAVTTPGGSRIQGDYGRHFFSYVIPPADQGSGQTVSMALVDEDTVHLRIGSGPAYSSDAPVQVWHRCGPPTS